MTLAAVAQLTSSTVIAENLATSVALIKKAAAAGAKAIFLPEATDFIAPASSVSSLTYSREASHFVSGLRQAAREQNIWISVGIHEPAVEKLLIDERGDILSKYRKTHLFDVDLKGGPKILESATTIPGASLEEPVQTPLGTLGLLTCYDLRFPEPSLRLRRQGAQILTYPSAFTLRTGAAHWEVLLRSRAVETQTYVLAAAQVGAHPDTTRVSWGHAMIVDPFGSVIAQCTDMQPYRPTFCLADIDLDLLTMTQKSMPLWDQRRIDLYPEL